jgi:hypothetical protein
VTALSLRRRDRERANWDFRFPGLASVVPARFVGNLAKKYNVISSIATFGMAFAGDPKIIACYFPLKQGISGGDRFGRTASATRKSARTEVVSWVPKSCDMLGS